MDERENHQEQPEDLDVQAGEAEEVKGGATPITADDDWESPLAAKPKPGSAGRGGWDGNHNETLVAL